MPLLHLLFLLRCRELVNSLVERHKLDRRRVEDSYYQFSLLRVCSWYPDLFDIRNLPLHNRAGSSIVKITSQYHDAFMTKYSGTFLIVLSIEVTFLFYL